MPCHHLLHVHELLDERLGLVVVQLELKLQDADGDAPIALQEGPRVLDGLEQAHSSLSLAARELEINILQWRPTWSLRAGASLASAGLRRHFARPARHR